VQDHSYTESTLGDALKELIKKASNILRMMVQCYGPKVDITKALTSNPLIE
jgi:hypothetical protein